MRWKIVLIGALLGVGLCSHSLLSQEKKAHDWFADITPSLLFGISAHSLTNYEGGVGIGLHATPGTLWRVGASVRYRSSHSIEVSDTLFSSDKNSILTLSLSVSPMFLLRNWDIYYLFTAPFIECGYSWSSGKWKNRNPMEHLSGSYSNEDWNFAGGIGLGGGINVSSRFTFTGEYRLIISPTYTYDLSSILLFDGLYCRTSLFLTIMVKL